AGTRRIRPMRVLDDGCGTGDGLRALARWGALRGQHLELIALDANHHIVAFDKQRNGGYPNITTHRGDAFGQDLAALKPDIVLASLFCHHFSLETLRDWLPAVLSCSKVVVVSDLHRHWAAHAGFYALCGLVRASPMT